jgi:hypothetical protein
MPGVAIAWRALAAGATLALSAWQAQAPPRDAPASPAAGTAAIHGTVVVDAPGQTPVRRAIVTLNGAGLSPGRTTVTDDAGVFAFEALPAGRFDVAVIKPGLLTVRHGAKAPGRPGTPIAIAAGERKSIRVAMTRGGAISGTVRDEQGRPLRGVSVTPVQYRFSRGQRALELATYGGGGASDDRGAFRIWGLIPGEYYLAVRPAGLTWDGTAPRTTAEDAQRARREIAGTASPGGAVQAAGSEIVGYAGVYYPGATSPADAAIVRVGAGDEHSGVDLVMRLVRATRVTGRLRFPDGKPAGRVSGSMVSAAGALLFRPQFVPVAPDGTFTLPGVLPGRYSLSFVVADPDRAAPTGPAPVMWAMTEIAIDGQAGLDVDVVLARAGSVRGRVVFDGTRAAPAPAAAAVNLSPVLAPGAVSLSSGVTKPPDAAGAFVVDGVVPGRYLVRAVEPQGWAIRSITLGGRDALDLPVAFAPGEHVQDAIVTFTDRLAELSGTFQNDAGAPAVDFTVVVFPRSRELWDAGARRIRATRPATTGRFTFANLPPGDYLLAALTDVQTGEWLDPAFLEQLVAGAVAVAIAEGERKTQDIRIR